MIFQTTRASSLWAASQHLRCLMLPAQPPQPWVSVNGCSGSDIPHKDCCGQAFVLP